MEVTPIANEVWLNRHERRASVDIAQSSVTAMGYRELAALDGEGGARIGAALADARLDYGWIEGSPAFKAAVSRLYGREMDPSLVLQENGATGANRDAVVSLVGPGDHVVCEWPTYQPLRDIPRALGATVDLWRLECDGTRWTAPVEALERLVRPGTRLICINNAANPTGALLGREELEAVADIARTVGAYVLSDEVYLPVAQDRGYVSMLDVYERAVVTNSLSKSFSAPGLRAGWVVAPPEVAARIRALRDYSLICAGVGNDLLATLVLEHADEVLARNRAIVRARARAVGEWLGRTPRASWCAPDGVPVAYLSLDLPDGLDDETFCLDLLDRHGLLLVPGGCFDMPGGVRLGYCCPEGELGRGLDLLGRALEGLD
ncbi:aminotransferase class I/II-fold pyridoxal phosphate-dependent enzyme [Caniella muris]|uniref:aminotransferase class I/II-fold pyridoxal phosphate-dependent enzyme n=1 Tax=Caniella muris TaxID=2941502 RepID=UPI00203E79DD|nr:aminotransferase class I/II-fold pyridoxal phosphate-dependent enzyme [Caniella muris]